MLKLIKYELLKKYNSLLIVLSIFLILQILQLTSLEPDSIFKMTVTMINFFVCSTGIVIYLVVNNILMFSRDLMNKKGYMLFMSPYNGYQIMGSKTIAALIENMFFLVLYTAFGILYAAILYFNNIGSLTTDFNIVIDFDLQIAIFIFLLGLNIILWWFNIMLSISLSVTIYKSLLANVKYGGLISFLFFLIINFFIHKIYSIHMNVTSNFIRNLQFIINNDISRLNNNMFIDVIIFLVVGVALYISASYLIEKKADF